MRKLLTILMLLTSFSCSSMPRIKAKQEGINSEFKPYIESYRLIIGKEKYAKSFKRLHMNFVTLKGDAVGRCWWLANNDYEIEIDPGFWYGNMFDPRVKEFLIYHELEHCIRYRLHTDKVKEIDSLNDFFDTIGFYLGLIPKKGHLADGCPGSLMHSHVMDWRCRQKHYFYYLKELHDYEDRYLLR